MLQHHVPFLHQLVPIRGHLWQAPTGSSRLPSRFVNSRSRGLPSLLSTRHVRSPLSKTWANLDRDEMLRWLSSLRGHFQYWRLGLCKDVAIPPNYLGWQISKVTYALLWSLPDHGLSRQSSLSTGPTSNGQDPPCVSLLQAKASSRPYSVWTISPTNFIGQ